MALLIFFHLLNCKKNCDDAITIQMLQTKEEKTHYRLMYLMLHLLIC